MYYIMNYGVTLFKKRREKQKEGKMPLQQLGMQAAGDAIGSIMGMITGEANDARQRSQQGMLQALQIRGQKEMMDYNMKKQLEMWNATGYGAQKDMMKAAGLNPALMYGMSGGGGQSTGNASGNVTGGVAPSGGGEIMGMIGQTTQRALLEAQKENIEANTEKTKAETVKTSGVDTKLGETQVTSLLQGVESAKAQQELTKMQTENAEIQNDIQGATQNAAKALIMTQLRQNTETLQMLANEKEISNETLQAKIQLVQQELVGTYAKNELTRAQIGKTDADREQLAKTIALEYAKLANEKDKTKIAQQVANFQTSFGGQAASILSTLLGIKQLGLK